MVTETDKYGGRFSLICTLGQGGMGQVLLADDRESARSVALKFLHPGLPAQALRFFKEEARLLTRLSHPNLVRIFDFFEQGVALEGFPAGPCISMEWVEGMPCSKLPADEPVERWIDLFVQLAQGLHYLHNRQILHRDLKPSNVLVTAAGEAKILDFGLASLQSEGRRGTAPMGTLAYMPPEAYWGEYDQQSDLFSLGVLFYELLAGRLPFEKPLSQVTPSPGASPPSPPQLAEIRPDLPVFFCDLIHRLLELNPSRRPSSALSLIRYINQHVETPFSIMDEADSEAVLGKATLVGRDSEIKQSWEFFQERKKSGQAGVLVLKGPTGVGRSRLMEDLKWRFQLEGIPFATVPTPSAARWLDFLLEALAVPSSAGGKDLFSKIQALFQKLAAVPTILALQDLQDWEPKALLALGLMLSRAKRELPPLWILLEFSDDPMPARLTEWWEKRDHWPNLKLIELHDLSESDTLRLLQEAAQDAPLSQELTHQIARASGGRPLLALEALCHALQSPPAAGELQFQVPQSLRESTGLRLQELQVPAQALLAAVAVRRKAVTLTQAQALFSDKTFDIEAAIWELERKGFFKNRSPEQPELQLTHLSLCDTYLDSLPATLLAQAHRNWIKILTQGLPEAKPGPEALALAEHALALQDTPTFKKYGGAAAEYCQAEGKELRAVEILEQLLAGSETPLERSIWNAHLAPIYYYLGRFPEALRAYDRWFADRIDDESFLQKVKHRFYTGLVNFTWGKSEEAEARLQDSLAIGDSGKFPSHRPYHVRAHNLLAALEEKRGRLAAARTQLMQALPLAQGMPLQLGEIEQRLGRLAQLRQDYLAARQHFERALAHYRETENPQAQGIAWHALGMLHLERGELAEALPAMQEAVRLAQKSGDLLQWARYKENFALVQLDLSRLAEAMAEMNAAEDLLNVLGKTEDRLLVQMHQADLFLRLGNLDQAVPRLKRLQGQKDQLQAAGFWEEYLLLQGEWAYLTHRWEDAASLFSQVLTRPNPSVATQSITASLGLIRAALRGEKLSWDKLGAFEKIAASLKGLDGPIYSTWRKLLAFLGKDPSAWNEAELVEVLRAIKGNQRPETRMDLYSLLAQLFGGRALSNLSQRLKLAAQAEFANMLQSLPEELKMDFEKNRSLDSLNEALGEVLPTPAAETTTPPPAAKTGGMEEGKINENRFRQYSEINRQIAQKTELGDILERVMDAAIELTGAERGFLLLKGGEAQGQFLKGYEVKTARHLNQRSLGEEEFQFSMTAVRQAVDQGTYLLTDNAQLDPRFQQKTSVMQFQLKSILVVPLELEGQVLGGIYLDHRYQPNCFSPEDVTLLTAFASQAALAIQKAQMVAELKRAKERLEVEVQDQARHIEVLTGEIAQMRDQLKFEYKEIVGQSPPMMQVFQMLDHVTETTIPVWILGESGTGKELIARSLHFNSPRKGGPFVTENCSSIPETLLESELFGHKKGSFTHADRDRIGLFEQATGGTLFLDEIADMSLGMQAKMLRVLQEGEIRPVGSSKKIKVDVRLVTASNRDLNQMVKDEKFRQDLFFRINGMTIALPPLRERKEDIPLLVEHMLKKIVKEFNLKMSEVTDEAYQTMFRYIWPGNIRELEGVIRNALLFAKGRPITPEFLSLNLSLTQASAASSARASGGRSLQEEQSEERQLILDALKRHQMDKEKVAEELGISLRSLYTRLEKLGIPKKKTLLSKYLGLK